MKLAILVEGRRTEPKVYRAWLEHALPDYQPVATVADLHPKSWLIISGQGYPLLLQVLGQYLLDLTDVGADHLVLCADTEARPVTATVAAVQAAVADALKGLPVGTAGPQVDVVIHNCCIETWFLGHAKMLRRHEPATAEFVRHYDVSTNDPELMPSPTSDEEPQHYHLRYLQAMLADNHCRYSKSHPGPVTEPVYFDALVDRHCATSHLPSLRTFLELLVAWGSPRVSESQLRRST